MVGGGGGGGGPGLEYTGPLGATLRNIKLLSVTSLSLTAVGAPVLLYLDTAGGMAASGKVLLAGTLCGFGLFTTGLLHWFASPYICSARLLPGGSAVEVEKLTFYGARYRTRLDVGRTEPPESMHPVANFRVDGRLYFLDKNFADAKLVELLVPPEEEEAGEEAATGGDAEGGAP